MLRRKRISRVATVAGSISRHRFSLSGWQGAMLALASVLFSFSAVRSRVDDHTFNEFVDTAGTSGPSMVFVTTAADCLALVEDVHEIADQLTVPTRVLVIQDGVSDSDIDKLVAAAGENIALEPVPWRAVTPIGRLVRTPFAIGFRGDGAIGFVESIGGQAALRADSFQERIGAS